MKKTIEHLMCFGILCCASICFGQITYTATDLGKLPNSEGAAALAVNDSGRIVGEAIVYTDTYPYYEYYAVMWTQPGADLQRIVPASFNPPTSDAVAINNSGQVAGYLDYPNQGEPYLFNSNTGAFEIIGPNVDLVGETTGVSQRGTLVGNAFRNDNALGAFTYDGTAVTYYPGPAPYGIVDANGINDSGDLAGSIQVQGIKGLIGTSPAIYNAATSSWINVLTPRSGVYGSMEGINDAGWAVGWWYDSSKTYEVVNPIVARKDGSTIQLVPPEIPSDGVTLNAVNDAGLAVGSDTPFNGELFRDSTVFAYDIADNTWIDLSTRVANPGVISLDEAYGISSNGKIVGMGHVTLAGGGVEYHGFLLTPIVPYKVFVQPPISADGSSEFKAKRGAVPVKFTLTKDGNPTCNLPPATISVTRTVGESTGFIDASTYGSPTNKPLPTFAIASCQYTYILRTETLGAGNYQVDINIEGQVVGSAKFVLQ